MALMRHKQRRRLLAGLAVLLASGPLVQAQQRVQDSAASSAWVLGQSLPIGAPNDVRGLQAHAATTAYVDHLNRHGGLHGRPVRLVTLEDGGDPQRHAQNLRQLVTEHHALALLNCVGQAACTVAAQVAAQARVPLVGTLTSARTLGGANPWVFRLRPSLDREAAALASQLAAVAVQQVALVSRAGRPSEAQAALREQLDRLGLKSTPLALGELGLAALNTLLKQLADGRFHAAWLDLDEEAIAWIVQGGHDRREEWPRLLAAMSGGPLTGLIANFKDRVIAFTSPVPNPEVVSLPLAMDFQAHAEGAGGAMAITDSGFEAYIAIRLATEALRRAGPRADGDALAAVLRTPGQLDLRGFALSLGRERASASDRVFVGMRARDGSIVR